MVNHRRAGVRCMQRGDPVYFCFCNMVEFKHYRLGFDRMFFIGEVSDEAAHVHETAVEAQQAALAGIREGVIAETSPRRRTRFTAAKDLSRAIAPADRSACPISEAPS